MKFCALASGSKGNSIFVGSGAHGVLIDAGLPCSHIERRMARRGLLPDAVKALLVTHEHRDHVSGVGVWARRYRVPVYMTAACLDRAAVVLGRRGLNGVEIREFSPGEPFSVNGLEFLPVATSHDAAEPVGFRITDGASVMGFATDLGVAPVAVRDALRGAQLLYLESNHDTQRLLDGPYPWFLKRRIRSPHGHLSNEECGSLVADLLHDRLRALVLGHLSEINNEPHMAFASARRVLEQVGAADDVTLLVARQDQPGRVLALAG